MLAENCVPTGVPGFSRVKVLRSCNLAQATARLKKLGYTPATCEQIAPEHRDGCHLFAVKGRIPHPDQTNFGGQMAIVGFTSGGHRMTPTEDIILEPGNDILVVGERKTSKKKA